MFTNSLGHPVRPADRSPSGVVVGPAVGHVDDVVGQHRRQRVDVTLEHRCEERLGKRLHVGGLGGQPRAAGADPIARSFRDLTCRRAVAVDRRGDLAERQLEHVVEQEHRPLDRLQCLQHAHESEGERVGRCHEFVGTRPAWRVARAAMGRAYCRERACADVSRSRAEPDVTVVSHAGRVPIVGTVGAIPADPRLLHHVIGVVGRAGHPYARPRSRARSVSNTAISARSTSAGWAAEWPARRAVGSCGRARSSQHRSPFARCRIAAVAACSALASTASVR